MDMEAPTPQEISYYDMVQRRKEEKGCLYGCAFALCCCFCCHEACEYCLDIFCCQC
ncbi:hypothetical protein QJS04_geneDACA006133 [Acorus gramineus]|uniref:Cysteine-rich transmembrane domain-containing protein n=1 Tax=Acorus gramineus TaxID=55184 RepID=A0AAV9B2V5_ACOGR|nr:hypothetical protein QJS04_geneDACA006133 [Acorus gramineus]